MINSKLTIPGLMVYSPLYLKLKNFAMVTFNCGTHQVFLDASYLDLKVTQILDKLWNEIEDILNKSKANYLKS